MSSLLERRVAVEEELRHLRGHVTELSRTEAELRGEIAALDGILGVVPEPPPPARPAPPAPASAVEPPPASTARRRRRKGSRRDQMLPRMRDGFASRAFTTEDVTDLVLEAEPGERRKAYFAAWSLVRDLAEDGLVSVVSEEGSGPRKKRTYRFVEAGKVAGEE